MNVPQPSGGRWTVEELTAAVEAYLEMLDCELAGQPYSKRAYRQALLNGPLHARTPASIEFRMQNISAVLEVLGRSRIAGYVPAKNVGKAVRFQMVAILEDITATLPPVLHPLPAPSQTAPIGQTTPLQKQLTTTVYQRDAAVVAWVLHRAKGRCERCQQPAPFITRNGQPFLEVHHVHPLSKGGADTPANTVALCPNCHRKAHYGFLAAEEHQQLVEYLSSLDT